MRRRSVALTWMKTTNRFRLGWVALMLCGAAILHFDALAQSYALYGTNQPGTAQNFSINVSAGVSNLAVSVDNAPTVYSHLLLKAGVAPSDTDYDFVAAQNGGANAINLEAPEFKATNYVLRVRTPSGSLAHPFTLTVATNVGTIRTIARAATKGIASTNQGTLVAPAWHYYRVEIPTNMPGWRVQLSTTNNGPDLYIQRDSPPDANLYLKRSTSLTNDDIAFAASELTPGAYYIGVFQPSASSAYTLRTEVINFTTLTWDPGSTHLGTQVYNHPNTNGGDYFFKITTQNTALGAWRTALNVSTGEANIYLAKGTPPSLANNLYKSERTNSSDGFVIASTAFNSGEDWYYLVRAQPGAQWNLVSGEPFVTDLGTVTGNGSSGSTNVVGAEGMRFYQTTLPGNAVAWRLWLNGITNHVMVKKTGVPLSGASDLSQQAQMLVVPSYLVGGQSYFVGVNGAPGTVVNLDSRLQSFTDIPFVSSTNLTVTGYGYSTFRVQVPSDQLAWQMSVVVSNGNPNLAVRRNFIPNENNNDAYSEIASNVTDSITLVPPTLANGTFFITVYSTNNYTCVLQSGNPEFTEISYVGETTNTDTNRTGWRFFKVSNIAEQLGSLGWDLYLTNHAPGTRLAIRRNAAPGVWNYRNPNPGVAGSYDFISTGDFLQRPGHQADVWYVGVFNTNAPLGAFTLVTRELTAEPIAFNGGTATRTVPAGKWQFFRVDAPSDILGWDLRLHSVTSGLPQLVVRREFLPISLVNIGFSAPITITNWPSGHQWVAGADWTARNFSSDGTINESGRVLTMGYGRPLEAATYYVGVLSPAGSTNDMSYSLLSRGIGPEQSIQVQDLDYATGYFTNQIPARDINVFKVNVPSNAPSWKVRLAVTNGDAVLAVAKDRIPNITALANGSTTFYLTAGKKMLKAGNEHFVQLPAANTNRIAPGCYYLVVASEGVIGTNTTRIGTGSAGVTLQSLGAMPEINLGLLDTNDLVYTGTLEGGESLAFHFETIPFPETLGFELTLEDRVGNPVMVSRGEVDLADPGAQGSGVPIDVYGNDGGQGTALQASPQIITVADPYETETVMVKARALAGVYPDVSYRLRVRELVPTPVPFDGGTATVTQSNTYEFFEIQVPENALGWDCRLTNVAGLPLLLISHGDLPLNISQSGWNPGTASYWPFGYHWIASKDWTQRTFSSDGGTNQDGRILAMGMGQPLQPGTYYVGVQNPSYPAPVIYTVSSRGIGEAYSIPVVELPFAGGVVTNIGLPVREAAYYRVVVPTNSTSWRVKLTPLVGESMLVILTNSVPSVLSGKPANLGKLMQKTTNEHFVRLPASPQTYLLPGTNYLAVISEGVNATNATRIGTNTSSFVLESKGEMPVINLGDVGSSNLTHTATLEGGESRAYQFNVPSGLTSLEVFLQNVSNNPAMVLRVGPQLPGPGFGSTAGIGGSVANEDYGNEGGYTITAANGNANSSLISVVNPTNGTYSVMVKARAGSGGGFTNAAYTLVVRAATYTEVNFNGGSVVVSNQPANTWRFYRVEVPEGALGWDVRVANVLSGLPKIVVARDILPVSLSTTPWGSPSTSSSWPTTNQWAPASDWLRRNTSVDGLINEDGRILAMGMGQPLEPGTYYVGVINGVGSTNMSYTFLSRGIGDGLALPVVDLNYNGGSVTVSNLAARDAAYFRVQIPANSPGWKLKLTPSVGEVMLNVLSNRVPNIDCGRLSGPLTGKYMQKAGNEHYLLLPNPGQTYLTPGWFYLAAASEGINPASASRIGSGSSTFTITSVGDVPVTQLGAIGLSDIVITNTLEGGESQMYQFTVAEGTPAIEMRLENRVGNPVMVVLTNSSLPDPGGVSNPKDLYGNDGGVGPNDLNTNILTVANPTNGVYTLAVKARLLGTAFPDASYTLRVRQMPVPELNFTSEFNTNGYSHIASALLIDSQRAYYKVVVPTNVHGQTVLGWQLDLSQISGQAGVRVRKDFLPSDTVAGMPMTANAAIIAPTLLTNGTWYVEVRGTNTTSFTLVSSTLKLQRPAWQMPEVGAPSTTPGLTAPEFGDSGVDTNGVQQEVDGGVDLELGRYHYYAVMVPTNNGGLLRVQLEGISGNPDVYIRTIQVPTSSHASNGITGTTFERSLTGSATDYGNFVPLNGKTELRLQPGLWYFAVRAVANANARYRLKLSTGFIQDLALDGGSFTNQTVAGTDWRYYRVQIPGSVPQNWNVTFGQDAGDVVMHVRDVLPPGNGISTNSIDYKDWISDAKNDGPYASYDPPNTYSFHAPPLRPNTVYYLGFRAKNDAIFSVSSAVSGSTNEEPPVIPFYGGSVTNFIPPNSQVAYRILTPGNALRWRHTSIHSNTVSVYIENGTYPTKSSFDDFRSGSANSSQDRFLTAYPWLSNQTYYLIATNPTAFVQLFNFNMNGSPNTADDDNDGMPDLWEIQYFNTLGTAATTDTDNDGVGNLNEYLEGTIPTDKNSFRPRLWLFVTNGIVNVNPASSNYAQGDNVTLTATPNAGYQFRGWSGHIGGNDNPLQLVMNTNKVVIPRFRVPGDDFEQRIQLGGISATHSLSNAGASKEPGEPNHAGNTGGKSLWWTWTAPFAGQVVINTAGTSFRNALAVYTGAAVTNLTMVATNLPGVGTNTSQVSFNANAGTTYQIAVDGFNGTNGSVTIHLAMPNGNIILSSPVRGGDGLFHFTITSPAGIVLRIDASTDLVAWTSIATVTNVTGTMDFGDPDSPNFARRYYRVSLAAPTVQPLVLAQVTRLPDGQFRFAVIGPTGQIVRVQAASNIGDPWTTLTTLTNVSGSTVFTDSTAPNFQQRLYRAISP